MRLILLLLLAAAPGMAQLGNAHSIWGRLITPTAPTDGCSIVWSDTEHQYLCSEAAPPTIASVAGDPNILGTTCTPPAIIEDSTTGKLWSCVSTNTFALLSTTNGIGPYTISAFAGTPTRGVAASRPSCSSDSLYIATNTLVMSQCETSTLAWRTLNGAGYIATWWDTSTASIHTYDENGVETGKISSGTSALGTSAISSAACATVVSATATGVLTTDTIQASFNGDPTAVTGYVPLTTGMLTIIAYPTADHVNFKVCNNTAGSITPGAITLNWRVQR